MAKSKNHTSHNQTRKAHRNGIHKPKWHKYTKTKGMDPKFLRNQKWAKKHNLGPNEMRRVTRKKVLTEKLKAYVKKKEERLKNAQQKKIEKAQQAGEPVPESKEIKVTLASLPRREQYWATLSSKKKAAKKWIFISPNDRKKEKIFGALKVLKMKTILRKRYFADLRKRNARFNKIKSKLPSAKYVKFDPKTILGPSKKIRKNHKQILADQEQAKKEKKRAKKSQKKPAKPKEAAKKGAEKGKEKGKAGEKPKGEKPKAGEKPKTEKPKTEKPKTEKPKTEKAEKPKGEEKPKAEKPKTDKPKAEKPKTEKAEKPKTEKAEKPKAEKKPKAETKTEEPPAQ